MACLLGVRDPGGVLSRTASPVGAVRRGSIKDGAVPQRIVDNSYFGGFVGGRRLLERLRDIDPAGQRTDHADP